MIMSIIDDGCMPIDNTLERSSTAYNELQHKYVKETLKKRPKYYKKAINYGMAVSLVTSIVGAFTGYKKAHVITGALFMGFGALHVYKHKKSML